MAVKARKKHGIDDLFSVAYEELRRLAAAIKRREGRITLEPTGLVNEAWLRLARSKKIPAESLPHFKRIAARAMRRVLVDLARERDAQKRGGPGAIFVTLDESAAQPSGAAQASGGAEEVVRLEAALEELAAAAPRQAQIVEWRFFAGLTVDEAAAALDVSKTTVEKDWRVARAWLKHQLRAQPAAGAR